MERLRLIIMLLAYGILWLRCSNNPMEPADSQKFSQDESILRSLTELRMVDYDRLQLTSRGWISVSDSIIRAVYLGQHEGTQFTVWDSARVSYRTDWEGELHPSFQIDHIIYLHSVPTADISVRYKLINSVTVDIDTSVALFTFPYSSEEIFITYQDIVRNSTGDWIESGVQDFVLRGEKLYVHPFGTWGTAEVNLSSGRITNLIEYPGGNFLTQDSVYLFFDEFPGKLNRYNLRQDTTVLLYDFYEKERINPITGLTAWQHLLYVSIHGDDALNQIMVFTYNGELVETITVHPDLYEIAISEGYLFAHGLKPGILLIMDLSSLQLLTAVPAPAERMEGFDIYNGYFYYTDYLYDMIGRVPLSALFDW